MISAIKNNKTQEVNSILNYPLWRQRILYNYNSYTPGYNITDNEWEEIFLPKSVEGKSILDIGANDGYFSFEAEKRGASNVIALDIYKEIAFQSMTSGWNFYGIQILKKHFNSKINILNGSVYELTKLNCFSDISICNNILTWVRDIPKTISEICAVTGNTIYIYDEFYKHKIHKIGKEYEPNMLSLSLIIKELKKNNWNNVEIKKIDTYNRNEWHKNNFEYVHIYEGKTIYKNQYSDITLHKTLKQTTSFVLSKENQRFNIHNIGWLNANDCFPVEIKGNKYKDKVKKIIGKRNIFNLKKIIRKPISNDYMIIVTK